MAFRIRQPVRHPDVDRAGIVYFPRFYDFFHRALEDFFTAEVGIPFWDLGDQLKVALPVVHIETDFEKPLQHGDAVTIQLTTLHIGAHSISIRYDVFRPNEADAAASSTIVLCCIEVPAWKKAPIPPEIRAAFEKHRG
jgi:4-hydroxybenzoyl-CoA thioesterase